MAIPIATVEQLIEKFKSRGMSSNYDEIFLSRLLQFSTEALLENLNQAYRQYQLDDKLFAVLLVINAFHPEGVKPSQLSELTHFSRVQVTRCVETLVKNELVIRQADPHDRRSHCLILSNKGINFFKNEIPPIEKRVVQAWQIISQEERQQLRSILLKLLKHLEQ